MLFNPKTENELQALNLLPDGTYKFHVDEAQDTKSKSSGADMIKLNLSIFDQNGKEHIVIDYLLASLLYKVLHFAETTELESKYSAGSLNAADCIGKTGYAKIYTQIGQDKGDGTNYPNRNAVKDYVKKENAPVAQPVDDFIDSEIPF